MITIISHHVKSQNSIYQPLIDNLNLLFKEKINLEIINSLNYDFPRYISQGGNEKYFFGFNKFGPIKFISDILYVLFGLIIFNKNKIIIALNPLNAFSAILYKIFLFKRIKIIYYIPDYSSNRFSNKYLNKIYHWIESFATSKSDAVVCVSTRVHEIKKDVNKNSFLIKNYPPKNILEISYPPDTHDQYDLVLVGFLDDYYQFDVLKKLIEKLNLNLLIIGGGNKWLEIKNYFKENELVFFTGHIDKEDLFNYLFKSKIGICFYSDGIDFNDFRDSVKCRDYIAAGLPILTTDNHSTAKEISENSLGEVLKNLSIENLVNSYTKISDNLEKYKENCRVYFKNDGDIEKKWDEVLLVASD
jgi:hypothetical protein